MSARTRKRAADAASTSDISSGKRAHLDEGDGSVLPVSSPAPTTGLSSLNDGESAPDLDPGHTGVPVTDEDASTLDPSSPTDPLPDNEPSQNTGNQSAHPASTISTQTAPSMHTAYKPILVQERSYWTPAVVERIVSLLSYKNVDVNLYSLDLAPIDLSWSSTNIKKSVLNTHDGRPLGIWMTGEVSYNGMKKRSENGVYGWPSIARVNLTPLTEKSIVQAQNLISKYSAGSDKQVRNLTTLSAGHSMRAEKRGEGVETLPFSSIYNAMHRLVTKTDMPLLEPGEVMTGDVVVLECTVGRYYDKAKDGRITDWNSNRVLFELKAVYLIQRAPESPSDGTDDTFGNFSVSL